jgi:hypothetical protein
VATRIQIRRDSEANWSSSNPVLASGELALSTDVAKIKIGDSQTAWSSLDYVTISQSQTQALIDSAIANLVDGAPDLLNTLNELAAALGDDADFINTVATKAEVAALQIEDIADVSVTSMPEFGMALLYDDTDDLWKPSFVLVPPGAAVSNTQPMFAATGGALASGEMWFDTTDGRLYVYVLEADADGFWIETGGTEENQDGTIGMNFPTSPTNADTYLGYSFDSSRNAWRHSPKMLDDASDVDLTNTSNENILMYNSSNGQWENVPGVKLDENSLIPLTFLTNALTAIANGNAEDNFADFKTYVNDQDDATAAAAVAYTDTASSNLSTSISNVVGSASTDFDTLGKIEGYISTNVALSADVAPLTVKTTADWSSDSSIPASGSINVELGTEVRLKIGDGTNTFANLTYVPSPTSVDVQISQGITGKANLESPVFSGNVSLPSTTTIGDVDGTEISYLDGVTSGIQSQLDSLDTLKAPIADPTFTGTVSGITKSMVGLSNVDNTADTDKPVSTAQQTALDAKLNLAGGTMTGKITLDGDPTQALHAVTKQYVDSVEAGLITRPAVKAATTANLSGTYTNGAAGVDSQINLGQLATLDIDGVTDWSQWNGVLVKNQTNAFENGRYVVMQIGNGTDTDWILKRCPLCDEADEIPGSYIFVTDGDTNEQTGWVQHVADPTTFTVGTDAISVYQFAGAGSVTSGTNVSVSGNQVSVVDAPVFAGTVDASAAGVAFSDGTQTQAGVPSLTTFVEKTASYQLDTLDHKDNVVEMNMSSAGTFTVPLDATLAWPVGASMDIFATGTGEITIAGEAGVTLNSTPGLILRTQWSSATIMKRGANNWVVYGDLKA